MLTVKTLIGDHYGRPAHYRLHTHHETSRRPSIEYIFLTTGPLTVNSMDRRCVMLTYYMDVVSSPAIFKSWVKQLEH